MCHRLTVPNGGQIRIESPTSRLTVFIYAKRQPKGGGEAEVSNTQLG